MTRTIKKPITTSAKKIIGCRRLSGGGLSGEIGGCTVGKMKGVGDGCGRAVGVGVAVGCSRICSRASWLGREVGLGGVVGEGDGDGVAVGSGLCGASCSCANSSPSRWIGAWAEVGSNSIQP